MKTNRIIIIIIPIAIIGLVAWRKIFPPVKTESQASPIATEQRSVVEAGKVSLPAPSVPSTNGPLIPIPGNWVLIGTDKARMLTNRETQLLMLDGFRGAIIGNRRIDPVGVAAMFDTLIQLAGDSDEDVALAAAFELYALGDYNGVALTRLRLSLKESAKSVELTYEEYYLVLLRTGKILSVLEASKDHRLDDVIFEAWQSQKEREFALSSRMEYAEYLERAGKQLPEEYWARWGERGLQFARELLRNRYGEKYQPLFQKQFEQGDSWAAATLYEQTGDSKYADFLVQQVASALGAPGRIDAPKFVSAVQGLARARPEKVREQVGPALLSDNGMVYDAAIEALKRDQSPEAVTVLRRGISAVFEQGRVPMYILRELASRPSPIAQQQYDAIKKQYVGKPRPAWHNEGPVYKESDFYPSDILRPPTRQ